MEQILKANEAIIGILGKEKAAASGYRMLHYCISTEVEEGILLFNLLTREMLLLTREEFANAIESPYLRKHWFVVPEETDEKKAGGIGTVDSKHHRSSFRDYHQLYDSYHNRLQCPLLLLL